MRIATLMALLLLSSVGIAWSAEEEEPSGGEETADESATLELLLDAEVGVATRSKRRIRETPGVVTLVTRDEIEASGARDLEDVLMLVPGFAFGVDVMGVVGIGFRGNWGHEGKVLLLLDGVEMNENLYSTLQLERHFPVAAVERVEIIRGPGSAVYGGYAELAVINVITRRPQDAADGRGAVSWGQTEGRFARRQVATSFGTKRGDFETAFHANIAQGTRSQRTFTDFSGNSFSMADHSDTEAAQVSAFAAWKKAELRLLFDDYRVEARGGYGDNFDETYLATFGTYAAQARWAVQLRPGLELTPLAGWKRQQPWRVAERDPDGAYYEKTADRMSLGLAASWDASDAINVLVGGDAYQDHARLDGPEVGPLQVSFDGEDSVTYENAAAYAQALWDSPVVNVAAGVRYENHSEFGDSFVPRLGVTKTGDIGHVKLLAASAFRAPGIENIALNPDIRPERTTVLEAEIGYRVNSSIYASINVFDVTIEDPIVYAFDESSGADTYGNFERTGTRGAEAQARLRTWQADAILTASVYSAAGKNEVPIYAVPGEDGALLGLSPFKLTAAVAGRPRQGIRVGTSAVLLGPRKAYLEGDTAGAGEIGEEDPALLLNAHVTLEDFGRRGLSLRLAAFNIAGVEFRQLQPYDGSHAPQPAQDREVLAELSFAF